MGLMVFCFFFNGGYFLVTGLTAHRFNEAGAPGIIADGREAFL